MKKALFVLFALALISLAEMPGKAEGIGLPYGGGFIVDSHLCTCSANYLLTMFDWMTKTTEQIIYEPGVSTLNANYNIFEPKVNVIYGTMPTGIQCLDYHGEECDTYGVPTSMIAPKTVRAGIGTGLIPSAI